MPAFFPLSSGWTCGLQIISGKQRNAVFLPSFFTSSHFLMQIPPGLGSGKSVYSSLSSDARGLTPSLATVRVERLSPLQVLQLEMSFLVNICNTLSDFPTTHLQLSSHSLTGRSSSLTEFRLISAQLSSLGHV